MGIIINLDVMMARRKKNLTELSAEVDLTLANPIRFTTLDALCRALDCQPGDLLEYVPDEP